MVASQRFPSSTLIGGHHEDPVALLFPLGPCCLRGVRGATPHDRDGRRPCRFAEGLLQGRSLGVERQRMRFAWWSRARHEFTQPEIGSRAELGRRAGSWSDHHLRLVLARDGEQPGQVGRGRGNLPVDVLEQG
jgi:hypothetical protein